MIKNIKGQSIALVTSKRESQNVAAKRTHEVHTHINATCEEKQHKCRRVRGQPVEEFWCPKLELWHQRSKKTAYAETTNRRKQFH